MDQHVAETYRRFAEVEAAGQSETYGDWARGVSQDVEVSELIGNLPGIKRQPNLVFAAARFVGAPSAPYAEFGPWLLDHWKDVLPVIQSRATQTNEAARCAVLLPILSRLDGDLALIEAGASAGLVLYPDRYSYQYRLEGSDEVVSLDPAGGPSGVVLPCVIDEPSVPSRLPSVVWRAGADLNPIDVLDADELRWLETLVWPEHDARRERLHAAAAIAASDPAELVRADLLSGIPQLIHAAPRGAHVVVFHSSVLNYVPAEQRQAFAELISSYPDVTWISNEGPGVLPDIAAQVTVDTTGRHIAAVDGRAVALTGPHGQSYHAL
jgi:hypothetical protein